MGWFDLLLHQHISCFLHPFHLLGKQIGDSSKCGVINIWLSIFVFVPDACEVCISLHKLIQFFATYKATSEVFFYCDLSGLDMLFAASSDVVCLCHLYLVISALVVN